MTHEALLRVAEAATRLSVSKAMIYRLVELKELPCVRVGVAVRIPENAVAEYIRSHSHGIAQER